MTEIQLSSDLNAQLIRHMADDDFVIQAAKVSALGENEIPEDFNRERFLNALMKPRHGVPWEHTYFTFFVEVPIFVARQWVKHRLSSMNEMSGRYMQLIPKFYTPDLERPLTNTGTKMKPVYAEKNDYHTWRIKRDTDVSTFQYAWNAYEAQLNAGVAEEMARTVLPVATYTQFYWSLNGRSILNFLERRVEDHMNRVETHPQWEIHQAARLVENAFARAMPYSHKAFLQADRVAP